MGEGGKRKENEKRGKRTLCYCMKPFLPRSVKDLNLYNCGPKCHNFRSKIDPK